jgi:YgiT-type zinc finger domain-containing protein
MKCVICHSEEIETRLVQETIWVDDDVVLVPCETLVCNNCGERYYDPRTMRYLEDVEARLRSTDLALERVGQVMKITKSWSPVLAVHDAPEAYEA